jgi:hypothetical protein
MNFSNKTTKNLVLLNIDYDETTNLEFNIDIDSNNINDINYDEYNEMTDNYYKKNIKFYSKYQNYIKCSIDDCNNKSTYNYYNNHKPKFCNLHKSKDMIKFGNFNKCKFENCLRYSIYNFPIYKYSLYCSIHKSDGMINVRSKRCLTPFCETIVNNDKYKNYCLYCFINNFPELNINLRYKIKEHVVIDFIKNNFKNFTWFHNKEVQDGCSKKRPDLYVHLGFQIIIVEIDEQQHKKYENICENKRIMLLSRDFDHISIVLIRFNPDKYIKNNIIIPSPWNITSKKGLPILIKKYINDWNYRLLTLKNTIDYWFFNKTNKTLEEIKLFFDE